MAWQQQRDHYSVLGVRREASAKEIDRAYRRAARATHPDVHADDASAPERFQAVAIAYETLRDPQRRASYDRAHPSVRPASPVRLVVHQRNRPSAPPVDLGRRPPRPEPFQPLRTDPATADMLRLVTTFSRLLGDWPFR